MIRCTWVPQKSYYENYHDFEWGVPVHDDRHHFEMLLLEGAHAGLSWDLVLRKREGYRSAFKNFDPQKVAALTDSELEELLQNPAIIRNKLKVYGARKNALSFLKIQQEFGSFDAYIWKFVNGKPIINSWKTSKEAPANSKESDTISKDLKKRGMTFVGTTIIYSYMQAIGMVNDHMVSCFRYKKLS